MGFLTSDIGDLGFELSEYGIELFFVLYGEMLEGLYRGFEDFTIA